MPSQYTLETGLTLQWYVPNRVLYIAVRAPLCEADSSFADEMLIQYLNHATEHVPFLVDVSHRRHPSSMMIHLSQRILRHASIGAIVMVGLVQNVIFNVGLMAHPSPTNTHHRSRQPINEAFAFLRHQDPTRPDLIEYIGVVI